LRGPPPCLRGGAPNPKPEPKTNGVHNRAVRHGARARRRGWRRRPRALRSGAGSTHAVRLSALACAGTINRRLRLLAGAPAPQVRRRARVKSEPECLLEQRFATRGSRAACSRAACSTPNQCSRCRLSRLPAVHRHVNACRPEHQRGAHPAARCPSGPSRGCPSRRGACGGASARRLRQRARPSVDLAPSELGTALNTSGLQTCAALQHWQDDTRRGAPRTPHTGLPNWRRAAHSAEQEQAPEAQGAQARAGPHQR